MDNIIHDIKTERQNVSPGLPAAYKLVPVAFYVVGIASIFLSLFFFLSKKAYESSQETMQARTSEARNAEGRFRVQQQGIVTESQRAEGIARWLEGSRPLQPVTVALARSMAKDSSIAELALERHDDIPANTLMQLKVDGGGSEQIETARAALTSLNYEIFNSRESKGRDSTDFVGTLIYNDK
tara:strand:+ start:176 stop:724 length:549 start_codon:yes stop_codon:yes gene_type:complete